MGDVVEIKTKQKRKPAGIPEKCYFRISTPDPKGNGPIYVEWNAVSLPMLLVLEETTRQVRDILFDIVQQEDVNDKGA